MLAVEQRLKMLQMPKGHIDVVLDTDAYNEIDDQFAISYALRSTEKIALKALYAAPFHNARATGAADGMEKSYQELRKLLALASEHTPVYRGSTSFLESEHTPEQSPAALDLVERAKRYSSDNPLYIAAIGAITNIASALLIDPDMADRVVIVWLGGNALSWHDNNEFNCSQDVASARVVFNSGAPLVMLPCLGVVSSFTTTEPELEHWLRGKNVLCDYLIDATEAEANQYARDKVWSRVIWDVTAIGWLMSEDKGFMLDKLITTPIPQYDHHYSVDARRPLCKYVYHINRDLLMRDLFAHISR